MSHAWLESDRCRCATLTNSTVSGFAPIWARPLCTALNSLHRARNPVCPSKLRSPLPDLSRKTEISPKNSANRVTLAETRLDHGALLSRWLSKSMWTEESFSSGQPPLAAGARTLGRERQYGSIDITRNDPAQQRMVRRDRLSPEWRKVRSARTGCSGRPARGAVFSCPHHGIAGGKKSKEYP